MNYPKLEHWVSRFSGYTDKRDFDIRCPIYLIAMIFQGLKAGTGIYALWTLQRAI